MTNAWLIYRKSLRMNFRAGLEYKGWWLMVVNVLCNVITDPISTILLFARFGSVGAWSMERILMIYAMAVASFGLAETFCRGFDLFPWRSVRSGAFDRMLLRPVPLFVQIAGSYFHINRIARVAGGLCAIGWSLWRQGIPLTPYNITLLLTALVSGGIVYAGVFIISSGVALHTVKGLDWIYIFTNASYQVTRCPVEYMPRLLKQSFTFLMPVLVISYYPASVACGWGEPNFTGWLCVPAASVFIAASFIVWRVGVRHYQSTGS